MTKVGPPEGVRRGPPCVAALCDDPQRANTQYKFLRPDEDAEVIDKYGWQAWSCVCKEAPKLFGSADSSTVAAGGYLLLCRDVDFAFGVGGDDGVDDAACDIDMDFLIEGID